MGLSASEAFSFASARPLAWRSLVAPIASALAVSIAGCASRAQDGAASLPPCPADGATAPNELRCTGLYADWSAKTVSPDAAPYTPGVELWSDGAEKSRWVLLPKGAKIDTSNPDEWTFPVGTKTWKEFRVNGRRVETRFYWKVAPAQWVWTTYRWLPDESRADRFDSGQPNAEGTYEIPDTQTCDKCHRGRADKVLGIEALAASLPTAKGITLASLKSAGSLTTDLAPVTPPEDATRVATAALSYLHMNCGVSCHGPEASAPAYNSGLVLKLGAAEAAAGKVDALVLYKTSVGVKISGNAEYEYAAKGYLRIKPGVSAESLVPALAAVRGVPIQMPPVASHLADPVGRGAVERWIDALPK